ncbi:MAG: hypothetical protein WCP29_07545 [Acidobacteriota bacterium]
MANPLGALLVLFGAGFLAANLLLLNDYLAFRRRRPGALLTWAVPRPAASGWSTGIALGLGLVILYKLLVLGWPPGQVFGEAMMFAYYGVMLRIGARVERGFYRDGLWLNRRFVKYRDITGLTWREDPKLALVIVAGRQQRAGRLNVPPAHYGEARRLLRDRIQSHQLHVQRSPIDLGGHDEREDV